MRKTVNNESIFKITFKILAPKKIIDNDHVILQHKENGHNKHYELTLNKNAVITKFGKIGTTYQSKTHYYSSIDMAKEYITKTVKAKIKKGYKLAN